MEKTNVTRATREFIQSALPGFPLVADPTPRSLRSPAPLDRERARAACAPMGALSTVVVTEDAHQRRRTWYIVDPDPAELRNPRRGDPDPLGRVAAASGQYDARRLSA